MRLRPQGTYRYNLKKGKKSFSLSQALGWVGVLFFVLWISFALLLPAQSGSLGLRAHDALASAAAPSAGSTAAPAPSAPAVPAGAESIKSPLMGIFYRAPSPSSPPFVKEGDPVKAGQTLCMIEAMKVFNELKADFDGRVVKILVENGKPVKVGQDLFAVARGA